MTIGKCPTCHDEVPLDADGRRVAHHGARVADVSVDALRRYYATGELAPIRVSDSETCSGSGRLSVHAADAAEAKHHGRDLQRIDAARIDAAVAHDALESGRPFPNARIIELRRIALLEYRAKFSLSGTAQPWIGYRRRGSRMEVVRDVYCTFCQKLILEGFSGMEPLIESRTQDHTTLCALRRLAGLEDYKPPPSLRKRVSNNGSG